MKARQDMDVSIVLIYLSFLTSLILLSILYGNYSDIERVVYTTILLGWLALMWRLATRNK